MIAVADGDHEVGPDEDHDLAGLDDLAGQRHRLVLDVVDRLEHQEQRVVVALELRSLVGVHRVLDGQRVQAENLCHRLHLVLVGLMKTDPDEGGLAAGFEFAGLGQGRRVGVLAGQPGAVDVDGAVDHRARDGDVDAFGVGTGLGAAGVLSSDGGSARNDGMIPPPRSGQMCGTVQMLRAQPGTAPAHEGEPRSGEVPGEVP